MQGAPHRQARSSARFFFLLPSVLALLALALVPANAFAGSGESVYETEIPSVTSEPGSGSSPTHHKAHNTGNSETGRATGSDAETGGSPEGSEKESGGSEGKKKSQGESSSQQSGGNPPTGGGGNGNNPNGGAGGQTESGVSGAKSLGGTQQGANASNSSGGGSSSPVVPILIAVVVLAAISIGVVLYRQRKSDQDGSDGRVSSSNAS